jgi:hypothetical protein
MKVADMVADNPGTWLFHCHVAEHMQEGMFARFIVHPRGAKGASADNAFFGLRGAASSMQIKQAQAMLAPSFNDATSCEIKLGGVVSVFDAFSVFTQPITVLIGQTLIVFKPDRRGEAQTEASTFKVTNASQFGVVYGALLEFEMTLRGPGWLAELRRQGLADNSASGASFAVPLVMRVGKAEHRTTAQVAVAARLITP